MAVFKDLLQVLESIDTISLLLGNIERGAMSCGNSMSSRLFLKGQGILAGFWCTVFRTASIVLHLLSERFC